MKAVLFSLLAAASAASSPSALTSLGGDLAHARSLAQHAGERLWRGYGSAPFGMLLVADGRETLLCQHNPPKDFTPDGRDPATGCDRLIRPRGGLPDNLLAAMPVLGPESTIVMGTPEKTGFSRQDWLRTILHEHFHQWQTSRPGYFARVDALGLSAGDTSGMWMLNFPFPYSDPKAGAAYATASTLLADALAARGTSRFGDAFDRFLSARRAFAATVGDRNWRYLEFELWQEGGARWTEYALAKKDRDAAARDAALAGEAKTLDRLRHADLTRQGRELVYVYGTAEIMLMDACGPGWRRAYPSATSLGPLLDTARATCTAARISPAGGRPPSTHD